MMHFIEKPGPEFIDSLAWLSEEQIYAVDTETTGLDPHTDKVLLLQIGNAKEQWVYDTYQMRKHIKPVLNYLTDANKIKVLHNAQFDYKMLLGHYGIRLNNMRCTMLAEQLLTKGKMNTVTDQTTGKVTQKKVSAGLAAVAKKYKNVILDKEERSTFIEMKWGDKFTKEQIQYAGADTVYLISILLEQTKLLEQRGMKQLAELEYEAISVFGDISFKGIYLDPKKWKLLEKKAEQQSKELLDKLNSHFQSTIDARS
jgi:DNA polymerase-1